MEGWCTVLIEKVGTASRVLSILSAARMAQGKSCLPSPDTENPLPTYPAIQQRRNGENPFSDRSVCKNISGKWTGGRQRDGGLRCSFAVFGNANQRRCRSLG